MSLSSVQNSVALISNSHNVPIHSPSESNQFVDRSADDSVLRSTFDQFVGETFYGQLLKSMRTSVGKPAYFNGGRAEEVFQSQLDQELVQEMSQASASQFTDPMYALFMLSRK